MVNIDTQIAAPTATRFRMPALLEVSAAVAPVNGRSQAAGTSHSYGVFVPAPQKGVFPGVRAWSPPVLE